MMPSINDFDNTFPTDKIKELVMLIRAGEALTNIPKTLKLALWIAGSTIETFYPMLSDVVFGMSEDQTAESLCAAIDLESPEVFPEDGDVSSQSFNPLLIIAIVRLAVKLVEGRK